MNTMMLHALNLNFEHPITKQAVSINADVQAEFKRMMDLMNFKL